MRLALVSLAGLALFLWPFAGLGLPAAAPAIFLATGAVGVLLLVEIGTRQLDSRRLALLAALAAVNAGLRAALVTGIGGFSPVFFLILCAGFVYGASFGFLVGATSLLVSALVTGGVGPWLPYQMFAAGWVGAAAGLAGRSAPNRPRRRELVTLAAVGILSGYAFGALMDTWDWTFFRGSPGVGWSPGMAPGLAVARFAAFYAATSALYDSFRAFGNALMVVVLGPPVLAALARFRARFTLVTESG